MTQLDISQAKASLSDLLDLAIKGEEIVITQNNKPIAKISPIKKSLKSENYKELKQIRDHQAFLNGYAPEDEGLYDDYSIG